MLAVALKVAVPEGVVVGGAGIKQLVRQFATWALHDITQFVTVEVIGVESPEEESKIWAVARAEPTSKK